MFPAPVDNDCGVTLAPCLERARPLSRHPVDVSLQKVSRGQPHGPC